MSEPSHIRSTDVENEAPLVVKLMKVLVNIAWYMSIFAAVLLVGILIATEVKDFYPSHFTIQVPLEVHFSDKDENIRVGDLNYPAVVGFEGIVSFRAHEEYPPLAAAVIIAVVILLGAVVYALYQLRLLMQTVSIGNPFHGKNPLRMRIIGLITLLWGPAMSIAMYLNARQLFGQLHGDGHGRQIVVAQRRMTNVARQQDLVPRLARNEQLAIREGAVGQRCVDAHLVCLVLEG